jgi:hypothetical protein
VGAVALLIEHDRRGNTTMRTASGAEIGGFVRSRSVRFVRLRIRHRDTDVGLLEQHWRSVGLATVVTGGAVAGTIHRSVDARWAGARQSLLEVTPHAHAIPAPLVFASVPALDAARKQARRERSW